MSNNAIEVSQNEYDALCLSLDKSRLYKRLRDAVAVMIPEYRAMFKPKLCTYKYTEKCLYSSPFGYKLQWQTRMYPTQPESYDNQQTSIGIVRLVSLSRFSEKV